MKTLYSILGITSDATPEQIENAYTRFSEMLQRNEGGLPADEIQIQTIAIRDAFHTLSNPILRQRYDQQQAAAELRRVQGPDAIFPTELPNTNAFGLKSVALVGLIILSGLYFYGQNLKERERLRIEHEHEVLMMKAAQVAEENQKQRAKVQNVVLEKSSNYAEERQLRQTLRELDRETARAQQLEQRRQRLEAQQEKQKQRELQQQQREEERRRAQELAQYKQQLNSDKRRLQQMERDRYGKIITY